MFYYSWDYPNPPALPRFEVVGDGGSIVDAGLTGSMEDARLRKRPYGPLIVNGNPLPVEDVDVNYEMMRDFKKSIEENSEVPFPLELAVRDLEGVMAIYSASNTLKQ